MYINTTLNVDVTNVLDNVPLVNQSVIDGLIHFIKSELMNFNYVKLNYHYPNGISENLVFFKSLKEFENYLG